MLATRNPHKLREFSRLLPAVALAPLPEEADLPPETGDSYAENALAKARAAAVATGQAAIADDSGIESAALGGRPGVLSARFAGPRASDVENLALLRAQAPPGSGLRYVCALAHATAGGESRAFEGRCEGTMAAEARGCRGFGYDPVFLPRDDTSGRTMAELSDDEKDAISHRGAAARALQAWLAS